MDTQKLIREAKARFKHQENKLYLQEKWLPKLSFAWAGGMWTATPALLAFLESAPESVILADEYGNPINLSTAEFKKEAWRVYTSTTTAWYDEYQKTQNIR